MGDPVAIVSKSLGGLFVALGARKTLPISEAIRLDYNQKFTDFAGVFPLSPLGIVPNNVAYKYAFGGAEILFGGLLIAGSPRAQRVSCLGLAGMMALAAQTSARLGNYGWGFVVPVIVGGALGWVYVKLASQPNSDKKI